MKMNVIYDKKGRIIAANLPPTGQFDRLKVGSLQCGPLPMKAAENEHMHGVFEIPDELAVLGPVELTHMMENVTVDMKVKKLSITKK
jgi:hypothetical protein